MGHATLRYRFASLSSRASIEGEGPVAVKNQKHSPSQV